MTRADEHRRALGFLTIAETDALGERGVRVLDPDSTLIARRTLLGAGCILYPTVVLACDETGEIVLGEHCVLHPGAVLEASDGGRITTGDRCELGRGGALLHAEGVVITLGDEVRLSGGCDCSGACELGRGAQILGAIIARSVQLGGGHGGHRWPVADERGAVLKGAGIAEGIVLRAGEVRSCRPSFADVATERQARYHPGP